MRGARLQFQRATIRVDGLRVVGVDLADRAPNPVDLRIERRPRERIGGQLVGLFELLPVGQRLGEAGLGTDVGGGTLVGAAQLERRGLAARGRRFGRGGIGQDDRRRERTTPDGLEEPGGLDADGDEQDGEHGRRAHAAATTMARTPVGVVAEGDGAEGGVRRACHK